MKLKFFNALSTALLLVPLVPLVLLVLVLLVPLQAQSQLPTAQQAGTALGSQPPANPFDAQVPASSPQQQQGQQQPSQQQPQQQVQQIQPQYAAPQYAAPQYAIPQGVDPGYQPSYGSPAYGATYGGQVPGNVQTLPMPMVLPPGSTTGFVGGQQPFPGFPGAPNGNMMGPAQAPVVKVPPKSSEIQFYDPSAEISPVMVFKTSEGEFKVRFNKQWAPKNVQSFIDLALGQKEFVDIRTGKKVKRPFYTGLNCHRVMKGFMIQCGCPFGTGKGGPGFKEPDELKGVTKFDRAGIVAMAPMVEETSGTRKYMKDSNGSQFFITLGAMPDMDGVATPIGQVIGSLETIRKIALTPTGPTDRPIKKVIIFSIDPEVSVTTPTPQAATPAVDSQSTANAAKAIPEMGEDPTKK